MSEQVLLYFRSLFSPALFVALARLHFDHLFFSLTESDNKVIYASSKNAEIQSFIQNLFYTKKSKESFFQVIEIQFKLTLTEKM